jgi:hypothetical protein
MPQPTVSGLPAPGFKGPHVPPPGPPLARAAAPPAVALRPDRRGSPEWRLTLIRRVRREYFEMPGMHLTLNQACRLFGLRVDVCERILQDLVGEEFLRIAHDGSFCRRGF